MEDGEAGAASPATERAIPEAESEDVTFAAALQDEHESDAGNRGAEYKSLAGMFKDLELADGDEQDGQEEKDGDDEEEVEEVGSAKLARYQSLALALAVVGLDHGHEERSLALAGLLEGLDIECS